MKKLIICDDDRDLLEMMSIVLRNQSFEIIKIDHCDFLQETIYTHHPFLVLIDLSFNKTDVKNIIASIKQEDEFNNIPFLVFSGNENIDDITAIIGADGFIKKPFKLKEIKEKIVSYLN